MRRFPWMLLSAALAAACGGHAAAPATSPTPAAGAPAAAAAPANTVHYAAGTGHYRLQQTMHTHQEAMGQVQDIDATTNMLLTAAFNSAAGGNIDGGFTIDSVSMTGSAPGGGAAILDALRGKTFHTVFSPQGKMISFTP